MRKVRLATALAAVFLMGACSDTQRTSANAPPTDSQLEDEIKRHLDATTDLKTSDIKVDANVDRNEVELSGTVATQEQRTRAVTIAKNAKSGVMVIDKIDVKPADVSRADYTDNMARETREKATSRGDKLGDSADDAWIHTKIVAKLMTDADTPQRKINVDVVNNVVTLRGTVQTAEAKAEAGRIAKETEGVRSVRNLLVVKPSA